MREMPQHSGNHLIDIISQLTEKEKEYQQALLNGKVFSELKNLRTTIKELEQQVKLSQNNRSDN
jgi:hypothetical protein